MKMRSKRLLSGLLVFCMCLSMMAGIAIPAWAYAAIKPLPALTGNQGQDAANIAVSQLGYAEATDGGTAFGAWWNTQINWNADYTYEDWCAMFACWCAWQAGAGLRVAYNTSSAGVNNLFVFLQNNGTADTSFTMNPQPGDFIFFSNTLGGRGAHVAVVESYNPATRVVTFVGGNQSDKVTRDTVTWSYSSMCGSQYVKGIGRPRYATNDIADPGKPVITGMQNSYSFGSPITFAWTATEHTTHYTIMVYRMESGIYNRCNQIDYANSGYTMTLPEGNYRVVVRAYNANAMNASGTDWKCTESDGVRFVVGGHTCAKGSQVFYEQQHPHYSYYQCVFCSAVMMVDPIPNTLDSCLECHRPNKPVLLNMKNVYAGNEAVVLTWDPTMHTTHYNMYIDRKNAQGEWERYENAFYVVSGCTRTLPLGEYRILLQSTNSEYFEADYSNWLYQNGDWVEFAVREEGCDVNGHTYVYSVMTEPTVSAEGALTGFCSECFDMTVVALPKLNATDYSYAVKKAATCTEDGIGTYTWITADHGMFEFEVTLSRTGHQFQYGVCTQCGAGIPGIITVSGRVTSYGNTTDPVTMTICDTNSGSVLRTLTISDGSFVVLGLPAGEYTFSFSKLNHVTRDYAVTVAAGETTIDAKLHLIGDVNGDGRVNTGDVSKMYAHAKKSSTLEGYEFACADINGDGRVNTGDTSKAYAHAKKTALLW